MNYRFPFLIQPIIHLRTTITLLVVNPVSVRSINIVSSVIKSRVQCNFEGDAKREEKRNYRMMEFREPFKKPFDQFQTCYSSISRRIGREVNIVVNDCNSFRFQSASVRSFALRLRSDTDRAVDRSRDVQRKFREIFITVSEF